MKEGVLIEQKGKIFPYDNLISALYGFNNKYGAICRIAEGGTDPTKIGEDPEHDRVELNLVGLTVAPEDMFNLPINHVKYLYDDISDEERKQLFNKIATYRNEKDMIEIKPMVKYNEEKKLFEGLNNLEVIKILRDLKEMNERTVTKKVPEEIKLDIYKDKREKYFSTSIEL